MSSPASPLPSRKCPLGPTAQLPERSPLTLTLTIAQDDDSENPRDSFDHVGTIAAWHRDYRYDENPSESPTKWRAAHPDSAFVVLPVFLLDHSGLRIKTGPFEDPWDNDQLGYIYCSREEARKEFPGRTPYAHARRCLEGEIKELDDFYSGNVWGYVVKDESGEVLDSCWGIIGDEAYCRSEGEASLRYFQGLDCDASADVQAAEVGL